MFFVCLILLSGYGLFFWCALHLLTAHGYVTRTLRLSLMCTSNGVSLLWCACVNERQKQSSAVARQNQNITFGCSVKVFRIKFVAALLQLNWRATNTDTPKSTNAELVPYTMMMLMMLLVGKQMHKKWENGQTGRQRDKERWEWWWHTRTHQMEYIKKCRVVEHTE